MPPGENGNGTLSSFGRRDSDQPRSQMSSLERSPFSEADEPATRDHDMVQEIDAEELRPFLEALGQGAVLRAGLRVARRMIVHDDERRCTCSYGRAEDLSRV